MTQSLRAKLATALIGGVIAAGVSGPALAASVADTLTSDPQFSALTDFVMRGNMLSTLKGSTPVTVFAPTNQAFDNAPTIGVLQRNSAQQMPNITGMTDLVREHVVEGLHPLSEFQGQRVQLSDANGTKLVVDGTSGGQITVATQPSLVGGTNSTGTGMNAPRVATVIGQPIIADNGVIYPINNVLLQ